MNRIFNGFENMLNFLLEGTKQTVKPNIRGTHLLCAVPVNRKFEKVTVDVRQNSSCSSHSLGNR